ERRLHREAGHPSGAALRRAGSELLRGAGLVGPPGAARVRAPARADGRGGGRVCLGPLERPRDAAGRRRGYPAGRRDALPGHHRLAGGGRNRPRLRHAVLGALRAIAARAGRLRRAAAGARRVLPRPRAHRADAVRRRAAARGRLPAPRPEPPGPRAGAAPPGRRALAPRRLAPAVRPTSALWPGAIRRRTDRLTMLWAAQPPAWPGICNTGAASSTAEMVDDYAPS